jgi:hypothetical protein
MRQFINDVLEHVINLPLLDKVVILIGCVRYVVSMMECIVIIIILGGILVALKLEPSTIQK